MRQDATDFTWTAPEKGGRFLLTEWRRLGGVRRVTVIAPAPGATFRSYRPLAEETGLFRILADTPPTPDGCLDFANRYGPLGVGPGRLLSAHLSLVPRKDVESAAAGAALTEWMATDGGGWRGEGEPLPAWLDCIRWLGDLVSLWDVIRFGDDAALASRVRAASGGLWVRGRDGKEAFYETANEPSFSPRDLARVYLHGRINGALADMTPLFLVRTPAGGSALVVSPLDLWGAVCFQFAEAVGEDKQHSRCPVCGRWFERSPGVNRAHKQFCSNNCRTKATRQRQARALALGAEGRTPADIAAELDTDVATIARWLNGTGKEGE